MKIYSLLLFLILLFVCCNDTKESENVGSTDQADIEKKYHLVWQDEFDTDGKLEPTKWGYEYGLIRNQEAQYFTDSLKNVRIEDGHLILETHKEPIEASEYTSASISTKNITEWTYGKIEISTKLPKGRGMWPAIWMLGKNFDDTGWPKCGEIDIMEHVGFEKDTIFGTVHTEAYNHVKGTEKGGSIFISNPYTEFHTYSVEWRPEQIDFMLDGEVYQQFKNENNTADEWPFDQPFFLKLNIAVGGTWGGLQGIDDGIFPQRMVVDYVRVYQFQ